MKIEPIIINGGSGFRDNHLNATRPITDIKDSHKLKVVSLTEWCEKNFISKNIGRTLIKHKLLIAFRRHHIWWVASNPDCFDELLDYLGVEELAFDADNGSPVVYL